MVSYRINPAFDIAEVIAVLRSSGLNRPADDPARLRCMFDHADLTVGAYDGSRLIGYARALSDRAWACYLADLAGPRPIKARVSAAPWSIASGPKSVTRCR